MADPCCSSYGMHQDEVRKLIAGGASPGLSLRRVRLPATLNGDATGARAWAALLAAIALVYLVLGLRVVPATVD
jgi:hypothetical protein